MVLTPAGKKLYSTAIRVLAELDETEEEIRRMMGGESGTIRVSTECYTRYHWLPPVLKKFKSEFPNVEIEIILEATHHPIEKLLTGELDLAITTQQQTDGVNF